MKPSPCQTSGPERPGALSGAARNFHQFGLPQIDVGDPVRPLSVSDRLPHGRETHERWLHALGVDENTQTGIDDLDYRVVRDVPIPSPDDPPLGCVHLSQSILPVFTGHSDQDPQPTLVILPDGLQGDVRWFAKRRPLL